MSEREAEALHNEAGGRAGLMRASDGVEGQAALHGRCAGTSLPQVDDECGPDFGRHRREQIGDVQLAQLQASRGHGLRIDLDLQAL